MKQKKCIVIGLIVVLLTLSACNDKEEMKTNVLNDNKTLVWRIAFPSAEEQDAESLILVWQNALNQMLKEKGADYSVAIKPFPTDDENNQKAAQVADELKRMKDENEQTDLITLTSVMCYPDLAGYHQVYPACAEKELLLPLDSLLKSEKGRSLKEAIPKKDLVRAKLSGTTYGISAVLPAMQAVVYSKVQMEQLGITEEELQGSILEKEELLQRVKEKTGKIPYRITSGDIKRRLGLWLVDPSENLAMNRDGKFVNITETREFEEYLKKLVKWKEAGLAEISDDAMKCYTNMPFVQDMAETNYKTMPYTAELDVNTANGTSKKALVFVVPDDTMPVVEPYWGENKICIASWTKNQERAEDFLIKLMTDPDVANLIQYGRDGKEYTKNGDAIEVNPNAAIYLRYFGYQYTNPLITYSTAMMEEDKYTYAEKFAEAYGKEIPDGFRFDPTPVLEQIAKTNEVFGDAQGSATTEKIMRLDMEDVDETITDITKELKQAGMDEIVEEANRQLEEWIKDIGVRNKGGKVTLLQVY